MPIFVLLHSKDLLLGAFVCSEHLGSHHVLQMTCLEDKSDFSKIPHCPPSRSIAHSPDAQFAILLRNTKDLCQINFARADRALNVINYFRE